MSKRGAARGSRIARLGSLVLAVQLLAACGQQSGTAEAKETLPDAAPTVKTAARTEPLLPRFEGDLLAGGRGGTDLLKDRRGVLFLFAADDPAADAAAQIIERLQKDSQGENIAFLGVSRDATTTAAKSYAEKHGFSFPILLDAKLAISQKLSARAGMPSIALVDNKGYLLGGVPVQSAEEAPYIEAQLRQVLRLRDAEEDNLVFGVKTKAPDFEVVGLDGKKLELSSLENKVAVVVFFLHTCPHCHDALRFLNALKKQIPRDDFAIIPISIRNMQMAVEDMAKQLDVQLALYMDPDKKAQDKYRGTGGVPNIYVLSRDHKIVAHHEGMDARIQALLTMEVRKELGVENPILLAKDAYSGEETCRVCHEQQHATWSLTTHAFAFDTLVERGEQANEECVACHSVGFKQKGGYSMELRQPQLEGVQCENCHGRGGPHQSPDFAKQGYEAVCKGCHNPQHSLRFNFAERLPIISHTANSQVASLSLEQRRSLLQKREHHERKLFDDGEYVGSAACQGCHAAEHENWAKSPHAKAFATLQAKKSDSDGECQNCHTTGHNRPGGFPTGGAALEAVGCESCHGPGKTHSRAERRPRRATSWRSPTSATAA